MRIIHIYRDFAEEGGDPGRTRVLAETQRALNHQVMAICSHSGKETEGIGVEIKRVDYNLPGLFQVKKIIEQFKPDIIHLTGVLIPMDCLFGFFSERVCKIPVVASVHGVLTPLSLNVRFGGKGKSTLRVFLKRFYIGTVVRKLLGRIHAAHAHSDQEARVLRLAGAKRVFVVPMGIDDDWLEEPVRKKHKIRTFTYFGRLDIYHKSLDLVLQAACLVKERGFNFKIRFAGSDVSGSAQWLQNFIDSHDLSPQVSIEQPLPQGKEKIQLFHETDFYLGIFRYGGMARACGLSIALGVPLIASREACWGDWALERKFGLVSGLNPQDLANVLIDAIKMPQEEYDSMCERAFEFAKTLNWTFVAEEMIKGYENCLAVG